MDEKNPRELAKHNATDPDFLHRHAEQAQATDARVRGGSTNTVPWPRSSIRDRVLVQMKDGEFQAQRINAAHRAWALIERHPELVELIEALQDVGIVPR